MSAHSNSGRRPRIDREAARAFIYPTNYPIRNYQLEICKAALLQNTLVCLPTGLGKTLIASVIMYNYYLWYPTGVNILIFST
jgi:Fanconi anemia group M protein